MKTFIPHILVLAIRSLADLTCRCTEMSKRSAVQENENGDMWTTSCVYRVKVVKTENLNLDVLQYHGG